MVIYPDHVAAGTAGIRVIANPENFFRSSDTEVSVYVERSGPRDYDRVAWGYLALTKGDPPEEALSPVKSMAPLPVTTTLGPTCCSVTVYPAWAGRTDSSDASTIASVVAR